MTQLQQTLDTLKSEFIAKHAAKEDWFWKSRMGLTDDPVDAQEQYSKAEIELNRFLHDPKWIQTLRECKSETPEEEELRQGWIDMLAVHVIEDPKAQEAFEELVRLEGKLANARRSLTLGYTDPKTGEFVEASSVKLSLMARTSQDEDLRKAAFAGLRSIETGVLEGGFIDVVRKRNEIGRLLGYEDFYDWRTHIVERMSKKELFVLLDDLAARTEERTLASVQDIVAKKGDSAKEPWNFLYLQTGELTKKLDPYFSFGTAMERWGRSFAAMNITFKQAELTLDLMERKGKYENGFMHGPGLAFQDEEGWHPARINFTANAVPGQTGAGLRALETLFHEGGHAAHFSNITKNAPCFSHEFAPMSVAYAETQSMFLDSLLGDADWRTRYAKDAAGEAMPWSLIEENIREKQPMRAWGVRAMLTVPFAERAMYEMADEDLTPENLLETFRGIERKLTGLNAGARPILSIPHLLDKEASAYYHGYVLAEMAVHQTRQFFLKRDGYLTDNPNIGPDLAKAYWAPGNSFSFQQAINALTGEGLSADALVDACNQSVKDAIADAKQKIDRLDTIPTHKGAVQLDATIHAIHGKDTIASTQESDFSSFASTFGKWVETL